MLGDSNNKWNFCFDGFFDRSRSLVCGDVDTRRIRSQLLHSLSYRGENWKTQMFTRASRLYATDHFRAPTHRLLRIGRGELASEALEDDTGVSTDLEVLNGVIVAIEPRGCRKIGSRYVSAEISRSGSFAAQAACVSRDHDSLELPATARKRRSKCKEVDKCLAAIV